MQLFEIVLNPPFFFTFSEPCKAGVKDTYRCRKHRPPFNFFWYLHVKKIFTWRFFWLRFFLSVLGVGGRPQPASIFKFPRVSSFDCPGLTQMLTGVILGFPCLSQRPGPKLVKTGQIFFWAENDPHVIQVTAVQLRGSSSTRKPVAGAAGFSRATGDISRTRPNLKAGVAQALFLWCQDSFPIKKNFDHFLTSSGRLASFGMGGRGIMQVHVRNKSGEESSRSWEVIAL